jgi:hypothetical protein
MRHEDGRSGARTDAVDDGQRGAANTDAALRRIGDALHGLRYGSVTVIVQDGVVVQIERTEKTRLTR